MSTFDTLEELQWKQLQHDERYHKDIWILNVQDRARHMVLHLSKYNGQILDAVRCGNALQIKKNIIDSLIISFSYANIFQCLVSNLIKNSYNDAEDLDSLINQIGIEYLKSKNRSMSQPIDTAIDFCVLIGQMAKTSESLDHVENHNFRENFNKYTFDIFIVLLTLCYTYNVFDLATQIADRLYAVETKNIYFKHYGNYRTGYI